MIDIAEYLKSRKNEFISLRELIERIKLHQPHVQETEIAEFLYIELLNGNLPEWVKQGIAGNIEKTWINGDDYDSDMSLEQLLKIIFELGFMPVATPPSPEAEPPMDFDDLNIPF